MTSTIIDRFHPQMVREEQKAVDAGQVRKLEELELLEPQQLRPLAKSSLQMLVLGAIFFFVLNYAAYYWHTHTLTLHITGGGVFLWLIINVVGYFLILPIHEAVHALAFLFWGGRPYFGTKLPLALYCGAKNQLFHRNQYLVIGLAPLVVLTIAGIIFTLLNPVLASYTLFASLGNVSGAAGDVWTVARLLRYPKSVLVEDTEAGYRVWEVGGS
jgi:Putative zincin peptidase